MISAILAVMLIDSDEIIIFDHKILIFSPSVPSVAHALIWV